MEQQKLQSILANVPDYKAFLTVDELNLSARQLANEYPDVVELMTIGHSRQGDSIEALKIGRGAKTALMFAMPHPNEPIGSMMLEYLSQQFFLSIIKRFTSNAIPLTGSSFLLSISPGSPHQAMLQTWEPPVRNSN